MVMPSVSITTLTVTGVYGACWLLYYAYTDTIRRNVIRKRRRAHVRETSNLAVEHTSLGVTTFLEDAEQREARLLRSRKLYGSLQVAGRFWNPFPEFREQGAWEWAFWKGVLSVIKWDMFGPKWKEIKDELPAVQRPDFALLQNAVKLGGLQATWIGQSTTYVQLSGVCFLLDPNFSDRTLNSFLAPRRLRPAACLLSELPHIDAVLVSHNHYDHLDIEAVKELGNTVVWYVPLGLGTFFRRHGVYKVVELNWWDDISCSFRAGYDGSLVNVRITYTPLMHWSGRTPFDTNTTLWGGFHVRCEETGRAFYHAGDTGYSGDLFKTIGNTLGPVDLALIPIGSYEPKWFMNPQHTDPDGAVQIALDVHAAKSIGVHWGTWIMSDEHYSHPPLDLVIARQKFGLADDDFFVIRPGQTEIIA